jgi:hypothetical protein
MLDLVANVFFTRAEIQNENAEERGDEGGEDDENDRSDLSCLPPGFFRPGPGVMILHRFARLRTVAMRLVNRHSRTN